MAEAFGYDNEWGHIICEDFIPYMAHADVSPLKLIGAVQYIYPSVILRAPQKRKIVTDEALKTLGAYVAGGNHRDVTESIKHAVSWLAKDTGHVLTQEVVFPR